MKTAWYAYPSTEDRNPHGHVEQVTVLHEEGDGTAIVKMSYGYVTTVAGPFSGGKLKRARPGEHPPSGFPRLLDARRFEHVGHPGQQSLIVGAVPGFIQPVLPDHCLLRIRFRQAGQQHHSSHAKLVGQKIVAMGGVPTVERNPVKQTDDLGEMLNFALEFETMAVKRYTEALELAEGDRALVVFLEDILKEEQEGVLSS